MELLKMVLIKYKEYMNDVLIAVLVQVIIGKKSFFKVKLKLMTS